MGIVIPSASLPLSSHIVIMAALGPVSIPGSVSQGLQRLVDGAVPLDELASLIAKIVSSAEANDIVKLLKDSDAQVFIDVIDDVWITSSSEALINRNFFVSLGDR